MDGACAEESTFSTCVYVITYACYVHINMTTSVYVHHSGIVPSIEPAVAESYMSWRIRWHPDRRRRRNVVSACANSYCPAKIHAYPRHIICSCKASLNHGIWITVQSVYHDHCTALPSCAFVA